MALGTRFFLCTLIPSFTTNESKNFVSPGMGLQAIGNILYFPAYPLSLPKKQAVSN